MIPVEETTAVVALLRRGDRPGHEYAALIEAAGSALAVLRGDHEDPEPPESLVLFDDESSVEDLDEADLSRIGEEVQAWRTEGLHVITILDAEYPANLRTIHNRPPLLFVRGELRPQDERSVAVVGTRRPSHEGLAQAEAMSAGLADAGYTVVSGLAEGIDGAVHRTALARDRRTVAVIGTGLHHSYPPSHVELQRVIAERCAVVSQFWPDAPPSKESFPMRNVVMSGLARGTVVIEASHASGARMQARLALGHGRPVFLLSSLLSQDWARQCADRPGAHVVESAAEVVQRLERLWSDLTLSA